MLRKYKILTITHRSTHLADLGSYVVEQSDSQSLQDKLHALREQFQLPELLYLATCNRVMYFFSSSENIDTGKFFQAVNPGLGTDQLERLHTVVNYYEGEDALRHLYEVAASIDSLVVGEREILRQLREAYDRCREWGLTADDIRLAMKFAVQTAKAVYDQTRIGEKPISVVSLAIQKLLRTQLPKDARVLMVGAGQTNTLVAKFLKKHGYHNVTVFNRNQERARNIAEMLDGKAMPYDQLPTHQNGFDCLIVCTGATQAIVDIELYQTLLAGETNEKLIIDLAIPHNIDSGIIEHFPVQYIEIDGLRQLANTNLAFREKEVEKGKAMINQNLSEYYAVYQQRQIERAMREVPTQIKAVKDHAINSVFKKELEDLDATTKDLMERMLTYMEKRCISIPMQAAKKTIS